MPIYFQTGITITQTEHNWLLHVEADPDQWLLSVLSEKVALRREALLDEWLPRLLADPAVTTLPADPDALGQLIFARADYKTRLQRDAEEIPPVPLNLHNVARFQARPPVAGPPVRLVSGGIDLLDLEAAYMLAYLQDIDDWILGAVLGHINRGKKKLIRQYLPVLMADPAVATVPANEADLINLIVGRPGYRTLPEQANERARN